MQRASAYAGRWYGLLPALIFTLACALFLPARAHAQGSDPQLDDNTSGTYYLVAFPDTTTNQLDTRYPNNRVRNEASLWIYSAVKNKVKITSNSSSTVLNLEPGKFKIHTIGAGAVIDVINSVSRNTTKIEADFPVVVYCYFASIQNLEAWTPAPVEYWGTEHYAAAVPGEVVLEIGLAGETEVPHTSKPGPAEILVIAAYDNTKISLTPPGGMRFVGAPPSTITLNEGEAFQVQSRVDTNPDNPPQDDIAGTLVLSDKPVGVISGNTRVQVISDEVGLKNNAYKNLQMEWVPPVDQHGKKFVYFPTYDNHRQGIGAPAERKREFARVYNSSGKTMKGFHYAIGGSTQVPFTIKRDTIGEFAFGPPSAVYFETESPAMAMMHSSAIVKFEGSTPCFRGIPCVDYSAWSTYMVEMVAREQWPSFAPYYAPTNPGNMLHFINVVTDTVSARTIVQENGSSFPFTRRIPGTDLVWGTKSVTQGETHYLWGKNGEKFYGDVYGVFAGAEAYRPGRIKKKDDGNNIVLGGGDKDPSTQHPCEYEEYNALSYGYPLSPSRRVLLPPDTLKIDTILDCSKLTIRIRALNAKPVGLRSITLDPATVKNAKLSPVDPQRLSEIIGRSQCTVVVEAIDPTQDAEATVIIKDRTGKVWQVFFKYEAERLTVVPDKIDFGTVNLNSTATQTFEITNPLQRVIVVKEIVLARKLPQYAIVDIQPTITLPYNLQPGEKLTVTVSVTPDVDNQAYDDTVKCVLGCVTVPVPLHTETSKPCIYVPDLNFGQFVSGVDPAKSMILKIENKGSGPLTFKNPVVDFTGLHAPYFSVAPADVATLLATTILPGRSHDLPVTFTPPTPTGVFTVTAHFYTNTDCERDSSVWVATVRKPGVKIPDHNWVEWVTTSNTCTKNTVTRYQVDLPVTNEGDIDVDVKSIELLGQDAADGYFQLETALPGAHVRPGDVLLKSNGNTLHQVVYFMPRNERPYQCQVLLLTNLNDTIYATLTGTGIESHGRITDAHYDTTLYMGPYPATPAVRRTVVLTALPTRPLRVTDVVVLGADAANYWVDKAPLNLPKTLNPGDSMLVDVEFRPVQPGFRKAEVAFVADHAICPDDSTGNLDGYTFTRGVSITNIDYRNILTCRDSVSYVEISNTGTEAVIVTSAVLDDVDKSGFFTLPNGINAVLDTLHVGETKRLAVKFEPLRVGTFRARIVFDVIDTKDGSPIPSTPAELVGTGYIVTAKAEIQNTPPLHGAPGASVDAPIKLLEPLDDAQLTNIFIGFFYNNKMMKLSNGTNDPRDIASMTDGTLLAGWQLTIVEADQQEGEYLCVLIAPPGQYLRGTGNLLNPKFQLFLGSISRSNITFYMLPVGKQCARIIPTPGKVEVDSVCGLNLRLIESTGFGYSLNQNKPNPFNPSTDITFSLGLDGPTKLTVYDESGKKVATLVDGVMNPGMYQVTWDATGFPSGLYYYRLESGDWVRTETMILRK